MHLINTKSETLKKYMVKNVCSWILNPPHASHIGEIWERVIETARRILNTITMQSKKPVKMDMFGKKNFAPLEK